MSAANEESLPLPGDPDRKRMLNVLAQRRYRKRRAEKLRSFQEQSKGRSIAESKSRSPASSLLSRDGGALSCSNSDVSPVSSSGDGGIAVSDLSLDHSQGSGQVVSWSGPGDVDLTLLEEQSQAGSAQSVPPAELELAPNNDFDFANFITDQDLELQPDDPFTSTFLFPIGADRHLEIPVLAAFAAGQRLANLFNCMDSLYDPFARRTTSITSMPHVYAVVPPNLLPVPAQEKIPHHPLLDLLPWPDVRTKLICAFSMPSHMRPPSARGEQPQVSFMQDIDDLSEPCRIAADNELDSGSWEIGNAVYQNWWWAFDKSTIENTNRLRALRGAPRLRLEPMRPS